MIAPFLDFFNGYFNAHGSLLEMIVPFYRGVFIIIGLWMLQLKSINRNFNISFLFLLYIVFILVQSLLLYNFSSIYVDGSSLVYDFILHLKLMYYVVFFLLVIFETDLEINRIIKLLLNTSLLIAISLIVTYFFGFGDSTYGNEVGHKGFYTEQNALSIILISSIPLIFYDSKMRGKLIYLSIIVGSSLLIGTKVSIFGSSLIAIIYLVVNMDIKRALFVLPGILIMLYTTREYMYGLVDDAIFRILYFKNEWDLVSFIFSKRNETLEKVLGYWSQDSFNIFFGMGSYKTGEIINRYNHGHRIIEMDIMDVLTFNGILFTFFIFLIITLPYFTLIKKRLFKVSKSEVILLVSYTLIVTLSTLSGHVLYTPLAATYLAVVGGTLIRKLI